MFPVIINDGQTPFPGDNIFYVVAKEGIFLRKKLGIMDSIAPVKNISILNSIETAAKMHIKKIPAKCSQQVINFFKWVYDEHSSEAVVLLFYNVETKMYHIEAPVQEVSGASLDYNKAITIDDYEMIGTIHSHANMSAFHSGVDDSDEASFDGLHITFGNMKDDDISISASIVANSHRVIVDPFEYMNNLEMTIDVDDEVKVPYSTTYVWDKEKRKMVPSETSNKFYTRRRFDRRYKVKLSKDPKFPTEWMEKVTKKSYSYSYRSGGWYDGLGYYGGGSNYGESDFWKGWRGHNVSNKTVKPASGVKPGRETPKKLITPNQAIEPKGQPFGIITDSRDKKPQPTPCDACQFKSHKVNMMLNALDDEGRKAVLSWAIDQLENDEVVKLASILGEDYEDRSFYQCGNCGQPISCIETDEKTAACPTCKTDEYLMEIEAADMVELLEEDSDNDKLTKVRCPACGSTFTKDFLNDGCCPMCGTFVDEEYDGETVPEFINCPYCGEKQPLINLMCDTRCDDCGRDVITYEELNSLWERVGMKPSTTSSQTELLVSDKESRDNLLEDQKAMDAVAVTNITLERIPTPDEITVTKRGKGKSSLIGSLVNRFKRK